MLRRIFLPLLLLLALAAITLPAHAEETADLLDGLKAKSYAAKIAVIDKLAASGDPSVVAPLTALLRGRLHIRKSDGAIVILKKRWPQENFP